MSGTAPYRHRRRWLVVLAVSLVALTAGSWWTFRGGDRPLPGRVPAAIAAPTLTKSGSSTQTAPSAKASRRPTPTPFPTMSSAGTLVSSSRSAGARHTDGPGVPRRFRIDRVGIDMPIIQVGVDKDGQMRMPARPDTLGWYEYGPRPGSPRGSAVLAGHVDSKRYGVGPLAWLRSTRTGDTITVDTTTGPLSFTVTRVRVLSKQTLPLARLFTRTGAPALHIMTCGGPYLPDRGGYQDNVVVTAVLHQHG